MFFCKIAPILIGIVFIVGFIHLYISGRRLRASRKQLEKAADEAYLPRLKICMEQKGRLIYIQLYADGERVNQYQNFLNEWDHATPQNVKSVKAKAIEWGIDYLKGVDAAKKAIENDK